MSDDKTMPKRILQQAKPVGKKDRAAIEREAAKLYRKNQSKRGKKRLQPYVLLETSTALDMLVEVMELPSTGDVIDVLVSNEVKRRKL